MLRLRSAGQNCVWLRNHCAARFVVSFSRRLTRTLYLNQTTLAKVAEIAARGALHKIDSEFEQTNFPRVVHALYDCAERFVFVFDLSPGAIDHGVD